jgi:hypothetical protein
VVLARNITVPVIGASRNLAQHERSQIVVMSNTGRKNCEHLTTMMFVAARRLAGSSSAARLYSATKLLVMYLVDSCPSSILATMKAFR